jgi:hypothetical protein
MNKFFADMESIGGKIEALMKKLIGEGDAEIIKLAPIAATVIAGVKPYLDIIVADSLGTAVEAAVDKVIGVVQAKLTELEALANTEGVTPTLQTSLAVITGLPNTLALLNVTKASSVAAAQKVANELTTVITAAQAIPAAVNTAVEETAAQPTIPD